MPKATATSSRCPRLLFHHRDEPIFIWSRLPVQRRSKPGLLKREQPRLPTSHTHRRLPCPRSSSSLPSPPPSLSAPCMRPRRSPRAASITTRPSMPTAARRQQQQRQQQRQRRQRRNDQECRQGQEGHHRKRQRRQRRQQQQRQQQRQRRRRRIDLLRAGSIECNFFLSPSGFGRRGYGVCGLARACAVSGRRLNRSS